MCLNGSSTDEHQRVDMGIVPESFSPVKIEASSFNMPRIDGNDQLVDKNCRQSLVNVDSAGVNQNTSSPRSLGTMNYRNTNSAAAQRAVFAQPIIEHSLDSQNGSIASSIGFETSVTDETMSNRSDFTKDEYAIFGEFIANELRSMKTDQFRRKLKRAFQKCLLDLADEEEVALQVKHVHSM